MASKKIYLDNGSNVNAAWKGLIAISPDGTNWTTFPKGGLQVKQHEFSFTTTGTNNINKFNHPGTYVTLNEFSSQDDLFRFLPADVVNQSWATANEAVDDINGWIGEIYT